MSNLESALLSLPGTVYEWHRRILLWSCSAFPTVELGSQQATLTSLAGKQLQYACALQQHILQQFDYAMMILFVLSMMHVIARVCKCPFVQETTSTSSSNIFSKYRIVTNKSQLLSSRHKLITRLESSFAWALVSSSVLHKDDPIISMTIEDWNGPSDIIVTFSNLLHFKSSWRIFRIVLSCKSLFFIE